jgi:catechol 2,3-dioxygenase-like lactoylglutathione lyase family enzyme
MELCMLSHTTIGVADIAAARRFYGPLLEALGLMPKFADETWAGWMSRDADRPLFVITKPFNGEAASTGNGQMIAFLANTRSLVDRCYSIALENGGRGDGEPGLRPNYHPNYYGAYFRDLDGNKLCVCCHHNE